MTPQEIFDRVAVHLLTQNEKAVKTYEGDNMPTCLYRTPNGLKCAVGCLIPDVLYDESMEGWGVGKNNIFPEAGEILLAKTLKTIGVEKTSLPLLAVLQLVHDETEPDAWREELEQVAVDYNLSNAVLFVPRHVL
jgi:hypothetical protein